MTDTSNLNDKIIAVLKTIFDPEIPVNLYDLGLIYNIDIQGKKAIIQMTLTNPGCPVAGEFPQVVKSHVETLSELDEVEIEMVWEPQWTTDRMSEAAKLQLGLV